MKKYFVIIALASLVLLASCGNTATPSSSESTGTSSSGDTQQVAQDITTQEQLIAYSEDLIWKTDNTVLFFHADWCGSCRTIEANLLESGLPDDLSVLKIDFDNADALRKQYGVTEKHTFVQVDAEGNTIKKWNGSLTLEDLQSQLVNSQAVSTDTSDSDVSAEQANTSDIQTQETVAIETQQEPESQVVVAVETQETQAPVALAGSYIEYDAAQIGQTQDTVLFFHASWCGTCRAADGKFASQELPEDLTLMKIDFDAAGDLRKKYGVTTQHTLVQIDAQGNLVHKWSGSKNIEDIVSNLK